MKDYYRILNVSPNTSKDEIRSAYRKLALKYHPDKNKNDPVAAAKFIEIQEAYSILSDDTKKRFFGFGDIPLEQMMAFVLSVMKTMISQTNYFIPAYQQVINVNMPVTLEDLYNKRVKKVNVRVIRYGKKDAIEPLYISLLNYQKEYVFKGVGDDLGTHEGCKRGDICVHLKVQQSDNDKHISIDTIISPFDLNLDIRINLLDFFYSETLSTSFFNNQRLTLPYKIGDRVLVLENYGLPKLDTLTRKETRGKLYIYISLDLPTKDDVKSRLKSEQDREAFRILLAKIVGHDV